MLSWVEREKCFVTSGPGGLCIQVISSMPSLFVDTLFNWIQSEAGNKGAGQTERMHRFT